MSDNTRVSAAARLRELHELLWRRRGLGLSRWDPVTQQAVSLLPEIAAVIEDAEDREQGEHIGECRCSRRRALAALSARLGGE